MGSAAPELLEPHAVLAPLFDQLHFQPPASLGPRGRVGRWMRRIARAVLRPWFERQTHFNQQLIDVLASFLREMDRRQQLVDERMAQLIQHFDQKLGQHDMQVQSRIADLAHIEVTHIHRAQAIESRLADKLEYLKQQLHNADVLPRDGRISRGVRDMLFFQTRLPAPSARLFVRGLNDHEVQELAVLGFQMESDSCDAAILRGSLEDIATTLDEQSSRLRSGARVLLSIPATCENWSAPAGFTCVETQRAANEAAQTWVVLQRN